MSTPWKVGETQSKSDSAAGRHGYGFVVQNFQGLPLLTVTYDSEDEATAAETLMRQIMESAADVVGHSGS